MARFFDNLIADWLSSDMQDLWKLCGFWILLCFITSVLSKNYSQVDKLWSITPWVYVWVYVIKSGVDQRLLWMAFISTLWGIRLTLNFARRGGYTWPPWEGEEDYRWEHVRKDPKMNADQNPIRWQIFNFVFICVYQHFLLWMIATPAHIAFKHRGVPMNSIDWSLGGLFLVLLFLEARADNEQYAFQTEKYRKINARIPRTGMEKNGFNSAGLWALCRHPNYACEQGMWILFAGFSVALEGLNWSILGCLLLVSLFTPSAQLSEGITARKYPAYKRYCKAKWMFLPFGGEYEVEN